MRQVRTLTATFVAAVLAVAFSGPSAADPTGPDDATAKSRAVAPGTLVFINGHDIWLALGDGSGRYQVTTDGTAATPYRSPSMSDQGIIAAGHGDELVRLKQNGTVLNRMDPPAQLNSVSQPVDGPPVHVSISGDGALIAYTMVGYGCPVVADCLARAVTGVTSSSSFTGPGTTSYFRQPSWVSGSRLMVHGGYGSQVMLQDLGGAPVHWFDDRDLVGDANSTDLSDASLSNDGLRLAAVRGYGAERRLTWYAVSGDPRTDPIAGLPTPTRLCGTTPDSGISWPDWSPDGNSLVFGSSEGLYVVTGFEGCTSTSAQYTVVDAAGSQPSWSVAMLNPGPRETVPTDPTQPGHQQTFKLVKRPVMKGKTVVGKKVRATHGRWSPAPAQYRYQWLRKGKAVKGATKVSYRLRRADQRRTIKVRVTVSRAGHVTRSATSAGRKVRRR